MEPGHGGPGVAMGQGLRAALLQCVRFMNVATAVIRMGLGCVSGTG